MRFYLPILFAVLAFNTGFSQSSNAPTANTVDGLMLGMTFDETMAKVRAMKVAGAITGFDETGYDKTSDVECSGKKIKTKFSVLYFFQNNQLHKVAVDVKFPSEVSKDDQTLATGCLKQQLITQYGSDTLTQTKPNVTKWAKGKYKIEVSRFQEIYFATYVDTSIHSWVEAEKQHPQDPSTVTYNDLKKKALASHERYGSTFISDLKMGISAKSYQYAMDKLVQSKLVIKSDDNYILASTFNDPTAGGIYMQLEPQFKDDRLVQIKCKSVPTRGGQTMKQIHNALFKFFNSAYGTYLMQSEANDEKQYTWMDGNVSNELKLGERLTVLTISLIQP